MSAVTVAHLDELREDASRWGGPAARADYQDAITKAPRLVMIGHLLGLTCSLVVLAGRVARHGVMEWYIAPASRR